MQDPSTGMKYWAFDSKYFIDHVTKDLRELNDLYIAKIGSDGEVSMIGALQQSCF